jgi:glycine betaine/choline ABC-type transport system substrate-binding protein
MNFSDMYSPNLISQGASVITEISSENGYKNLASSNNYEVTHGPKLPQNNFQKVQNYTTSDKIKVHYDYTGRGRTCANQKRRKSAHAPDAQLWSLKSAHI